MPRPVGRSAWRRVAATFVQRQVEEVEPSPPSSRPPRRRRYERLVWAGYAMMGASIAVLAVVAALTLRETVSQKDEILFGEVEDVLQVERLRADTELESRKQRSFLLRNEQQLLDEVFNIERRIDAGFDRLHARTNNPRGEQLLDAVERLHLQTRSAMATAMAMRRRGDPLEDVARFYDDQVTLHREHLDVAFEALERHEEAQFEAAKQTSLADTDRTTGRLLGASLATMVVAGATGIVLFLALRALRVQQRALDRHVAQISEANRDLDAFAGRIAHDLKNVLSPLPLIARLLREKQDVAASSERIERVAIRATAMLEALLAFARAGRPSDTAAASSLEAVTRDVIEDLRPVIAAADARIDVELEPLEVGCSAGLLSIVLSNILGNALKFLEARPVRQVTIGARAEGNWCALRVTDTGPGIPREALRRIFEPFYRVPGNRAPGTGIGLATVQRIVDAHDGRIVVESELGRGTTFSVWLPLAGT